MNLQEKPSCFKFLFVYFLSLDTDSYFSVTFASSGLCPSQFPLSRISYVLTLNFGALLFKVAVGLLPLPLKNAYFLLLFISLFFTFLARLSHIEIKFYAPKLFAVWLQ